MAGSTVRRNGGDCMSGLHKMTPENTTASGQCKRCAYARMAELQRTDKPAPLYVRPEPYQADPNDPAVQTARMERERFLERHPSYRHYLRGSGC